MTRGGLTDERNDAEEPSWDEGPDEGDLPDSDDLPMMACPACGGSVAEDTEKCPYCGDWITPVEPREAGWRRWALIAVVVLAILLVSYSMR